MFLGTPSDSLTTFLDILYKVLHQMNLKYKENHITGAWAVENISMEFNAFSIKRSIWLMSHTKNAKIATKDQIIIKVQNLKAFNALNIKRLKW